MTDRPDAVAETTVAPKRRAGRLVSLVLFVAVLTVTLAGGALYYLHWNFNRAGPLAAARTVMVPSGAGVTQIALLLAANGVVEDADLFVAGICVFGGPKPLRAGEYAFDAHISARDALEVLQTAEPVVYRLTVPEGLTTAEIRAIVDAADGLAGETPVTEEGSLLPETYHFHRGDSRAGVVARMQSAMTATLAELWPNRASDLPFDDPREALVLASIVEKETGLAAERPRVAAVFVNRLKRGMKLQSDPTVAYALTDGKGGLDRALLRADLAVDHPYNTYVIAGLPPGPIANPGRASIAAVLNPLSTQDLYFVADGTGGHAFARTLAEHNRNVAKWRSVQRRNRAKHAE
jgi:UPF0755 protein